MLDKQEIDNELLVGISGINFGLQQTPCGMPTKQNVSKVKSFGRQFLSVLRIRTFNSNWNWNRLHVQTSLSCAHFLRSTHINYPSYKQFNLSFTSIRYLWLVKNLMKLMEKNIERENIESVE